MKLLQTRQSCYQLSILTQRKTLYKKHKIFHGKNKESIGGPENSCGKTARLHACPRQMRVVCLNLRIGGKVGEWQLFFAAETNLEMQGLVTAAGNLPDSFALFDDLIEPDPDVVESGVDG